jgi:hypothetical protein
VKKLFALISVLCCLLSVCCTAPPRAPAPTFAACHAAPDVTSSRVWREMDLLLHADTSFPAADRADIEAAARSWREVSKGRANLRVTFDLDFTSASSLRAHYADAQIRNVTSDLDAVHRVEERLARGPSVAIVAWKQSRDFGLDLIYIVRDRIHDQTKLRAVATHELGHVLGMPDLAEMGSIMSGSSTPWKPEPETFTLEDVALCRSFSYCD